MSEQNKKSLSSFMKKQISEKSSKNDSTKKPTINGFGSKAKTEKEKDKDQTEETDEEKELAEAKKASRGKAANYDQSHMIKKLLLESIVKCTLAIAVLAIIAIGLIEGGPAILKFLLGLFHRILVGIVSQ